MKTRQPKLKNPPRPLFSCAFFRHCTQYVLSPTTSHPPPLPFPPSNPLPPPTSPPQPPPPPPPPRQPESSSSSSTSSASHSFTQWRFPLPDSPLHHSPPPTTPSLPPPPPPPPISSAALQELFHAAELKLTSGSDYDHLAALHLLERSLVPNPPSDPPCPPDLMRGVVRNLKNQLGAKPATKILLALCLAEPNRHVAIEAGAAATVVEVAPELEGAAAERALAALELMCTVAEGAAEVRAHALAVPVMVTMMGQMTARGKEYAISVLAVIFGGGSGDQAAPPEEVARAVELALRGDCTGRGRRKGALLLKALQEYGRMDLTEDGK